MMHTNSTPKSLAFNYKLKTPSLVVKESSRFPRMAPRDPRPKRISQVDAHREPRPKGISQSRFIPSVNAHGEPRPKGISPVG